MLLSFDLMSTFVLNDLHFSPCSLVSGWPQESDLPHGQQGAVLWTSWNTSGVSDLTIRAWCQHYICLWKPLTCRLLTFTYNTEQIIGLFYCFHATERSDFYSTSTSWNVPVLWCCWSSSVPPHRSETIFTYLSCALQHFTFLKSR